MTESAPAEVERPAYELSGETLAWATVSALFVGLRLGTIWHAPVAGAELDHLSGAWLARIGAPDDRYVPTLFQALTSLLLRFDSVDTWPRVMALLSLCSVPFAVYLLRPRLGRAGALLALLLLTVDAPLISLGTSASAMGFDVGITLWLFVAMTRPTLAAMGAGGAWVPRGAPAARSRSHSSRRRSACARFGATTRTGRLLAGARAAWLPAWCWRRSASGSGRLTACGCHRSISSRRA